jgi:hypothetical protein
LWLRVEPPARATVLRAAGVLPAARDRTRGGWLSVTAVYDLTC